MKKLASLFVLIVASSMNCIAQKSTATPAFMSVRWSSGPSFGLPKKTLAFLNDSMGVYSSNSTGYELGYATAFDSTGFRYDVKLGYYNKFLEGAEKKVRFTQSFLSFEFGWQWSFGKRWTLSTLGGPGVVIGKQTITQDADIADIWQSGSNNQYNSFSKEGRPGFTFNTEVLVGFRIKWMEVYTGTSWYFLPKKSQTWFNGFSTGSYNAGVVTGIRIYIPAPLVQKPENEPDEVYPEIKKL